MKKGNLLSIFGLVGLILAAVGLAVWISQPAKASPPTRAAAAIEPFVQPPTDQIIIKYRSDVAPAKLDGPLQADEMARLSAAAQVTVTYKRPMSGNAHVLKLPQAMTDESVAVIAARLAALSDVEYAEPDSIMLPLDTIPNDTQWGDQWDLLTPFGDHYGINAPAAWDITTGSASTVVAVIDTGITAHPDLNSQVVPGYDFISNSFMGNDGQAAGGLTNRDGDPSDPGDWLDVGEDCFGSTITKFRGSSWHGTHVAGTIGAASNNSTGIAGINWNGKILPVRVLGKCGGNQSDIIDGARWAAGLVVNDDGGNPIPNPNPAKVLNLSLGGRVGCTDPGRAAYQTAINEIVAAGAVFVVAAGNDDEDASGFSPASCDNVITVASTNRDGGRAYYSNFGTMVEIAAPGGAQSFANDPNGTLSTLNDGDRSPGNPNYEYYQGTSMAAPHVAGVASLLFACNGNLSPAQVLSILQTNVTAFPGGSTCDTSLCGTGILNAFEAVKAAGCGAVVPTDTPTVTASPTEPGPSATPTVTPTRRPTRTGTITPDLLSFLPLAVKGAQGSKASPTPSVTAARTPTSTPTSTPTTPVSGGWQTLMSENFEGSFPTGWSVVNQGTSGDYGWGKRDCNAFEGNFSGWGVGGGTDGSGLGCGSNYPDDVDAWMVFGPVNLSDASSANLTFKLWLDSEQDFDKICRMASTDGQNFSGSCTSGNTGGWIDRVLDLSNVGSLNLLGQSQVWIALRFNSDVLTNLPVGAYVDNITLQKCVGSCTAAVLSNESLPGVTDVMDSAVKPDPDPQTTQAGWQALGSGTDGYIWRNAMAVGPDGSLYVGGGFFNAGGQSAKIARWKDGVWTPIATSAYNIAALAVDSMGNLYAGGMFQTIDGVPVNSVAKWNGSSWSALGSGLTIASTTTTAGYAYALAIDSANNLYVGGWFTHAGGVAANSVARWNGSGWEAVGSGTSKVVNDLVLAPGDVLYAGGSFEQIGGVSANHIARWNGSGWEALGGGLTYPVNTTDYADVMALAVDGSNVYAAGNFSLAGGNPANNVAVWNGSAWSAMGSGPNNLPEALVISGGSLYMGGRFSQADGNVVNHIARWNGSGWEAVGGGTNQDVSALVAGNGLLYTGGWFSQAGGLPANFIAAYSNTLADAASAVPYP